LFHPLLLGLEQARVLKGNSGLVGEGDDTRYIGFGQAGAGDDQ